MAALTLGAVGATDAAAHVPHDNVLGLAAPADLSEDHPWLMPVWQGISRSLDGGWSWELSGGQALLESATDSVQLADGTSVLLGTRGLWMTADGDAWEYHELGVQAYALAAAGDDLLVSTVSGTGVMDASGKLSVGTGAYFSEMVESDEGVTGVSVVADEVWLYTLDDGLWTKLLGSPAPVDLLAAVTVDVGGQRTVYAGDDMGRVWKGRDTGWVPCGGLPEQDHPAVVRVDATSSRVVVTTASIGPYVSFDDCGSWEDRTTGAFTDFSAGGGADSDALAYTVLRTAGDKWIIGGWDGLFYSDDAGITWEEKTIIPPDYTRGVAFAVDFPDDPTVFIGPYASGVQYSRDGGVSFDSPSWGLTEPNVQRIRTSDDDPDVILAIVGHKGQISEDGGQSWRALESPFPQDADAAAWVVDNETWVFGKSSSPKWNGQVAFSQDLGKTWQEVPELVAAANAPKRILKFQTDAGTTRYLSGGADGIAVSTGVFDPWTVTLSSKDAPGSASLPVAWPADDPERLLFSFGDVIYLSEDDGDTWETVAQLGQYGTLGELVLAPDGTAFALTAVGGVWRSDDGRKWEDTGLTFPGLVHTASARPDFVDHRAVLVGTHAGPFVLWDEEPPILERWGGYQRVDGTSEYVHCIGCDQDDPESYQIEQPGAGMDSLSPVEPGQTLWVNLRGHTLRLVGSTDGASEVDIVIDGAVVAQVGSEIAELDVLFETEVDDTWHRVELQGVSGSGVYLDYWEAHTEAAFFDELTPKEPKKETGETGETGDTGGETGGDDTADSGETGVDTGQPPVDDTGDAGGKGCGCGGGGGTGAAILFALWAVRSRRTPGPGSAAGPRPHDGGDDTSTGSPASS